MADPLTANVGLAVPTRGSDSGTWDLPVNNDMTAIDGMFGGLQSFSLTNANVTLSVPATFVATPGAGPTQSQNAVIRFTGTLTGNCVVTFPRPGIYVVENRCTVGAFYVQLTNGGGGEVIGIPDGEAVDVYSDGTNMRFRNLGRIGEMIDLTGVTAAPAWIGACTVPPYLLGDGSIYNVATYPFLGAKLGATFGGNGSTTFGVPDVSGRWRIPYDKTGTRITAAGCGINGQTLGASGGSQLMQAHNHTINDPGHTHQFGDEALGNYSQPGNQLGVRQINSSPGPTNTITTGSNTTGITINNAGSGGSQNIPPALVFGITLIRAG